MKLVVSQMAVYFRIEAAATGLSASFSMALIGIGHLVGLSVGVAMLLGMIVCWAGLFPYLTASLALPGPPARSLPPYSVTRFASSGPAQSVSPPSGPCSRSWPDRERDRGLRCRGSGAPGRRGARGHRTRSADRHRRRDHCPFLLPIAALLWWFGSGGPVADHAAVVITGSLIYVVLAGAIRSGRMRLHGRPDRRVEQSDFRRRHSCRSWGRLLPAHYFGRSDDPATSRALVAHALFTTALVFSIATISNDNLQDLKDRAIGRRHTLAAAGRPCSWRGVRGRWSSRWCSICSIRLLVLPGPRCRAARTCRAPGRADFGAGHGRSGRQAGL